MVNENSNARICERLDQFGEVSEKLEGGLKFGGGGVSEEWGR